MGQLDTLSGSVKASIGVTVSPVISGVLSGAVDYVYNFVQSISDGSGAGQASAVLAGTVAVTTSPITISLANADPFGSGGDDVPSGTIEGLKLRAILIVNQDATNFVTIGKGTNYIAGWLGGTSPTIRIDASSAHFHNWKSGNSSALNDGVDDEFTLTADTATVNCYVLALFG